MLPSFPFWIFFFFQTGQFSWIRNIDKWTKKNKYTVFCINFILFFWIKFMRTNWRNNWLLLSCHKWNSIYFFAHWKLLVGDGKVFWFYDVWWPDTKFTKIGILLSSSKRIRCGDEFYNNRLSFSIDFTLIQVQIAVIFWRCPLDIIQSSWPTSFSHPPNFPSDSMTQKKTSQSSCIRLHKKLHKNQKRISSMSRQYFQRKKIIEWNKIK